MSDPTPVLSQRLFVESARRFVPVVMAVCCVPSALAQDEPTSRPASFTIRPFTQPAIRASTQPVEGAGGQPVDADGTGDRPPVMPGPPGRLPVGGESPPTSDSAVGASAAEGAGAAAEWLRIFHVRDTNRDGALGADEYDGAYGRFGEIDRDRDGRLDGVEFKKAWIITTYGLWVILPAIVAIGIAIFTRQVVVALPLGILTASVMMLWVDGVLNPIRWVTYAMDRYLFRVLAHAEDGELVNDKLKIIIFSLFIGAMVGVIEANGGTRAMVARMTRHMRTRQRGQIGAWLAGLVVFFDDYANAMIVGPSMRPVFDRLKLSREKLAYIVDSTAAPVASLFIGTWLVTEISYINEGLNGLSERPDFLAGMTGDKAFWWSLPYRTYAWLALIMVFLIAVTGRDFGSMRKAEARRMSKTTPKSAEIAALDGHDGRGWWLGAVPVSFLVVMTLALLVHSGRQSCLDDGQVLSFGSWDAIKESIQDIMGNADSYQALLYASFSATLLAVIITVLTRALPLGKTMDAVTAGMGRMFTACIVLVLAWGLSQGSRDLQLGEVAGGFLKDLEARGIFSSQFLPLATFITAALVSFATGTSWGTMGILCPAVVAIAARLYDGIPPAEAMPLFYATIGAVLTGAVFGDHCSPISDTTVLSSIASECDLGRHVWTQLPYALLVAVVGMLSTDCLYYVLRRWTPDYFQLYQGKLVYAGTALGAMLLFLLVLILGRRPRGPASSDSVKVLHAPPGPPVQPA